MSKSSLVFTFGVVVSQVIANLIQCFYGVLLVMFARGEANPIFFAFLRGAVSTPVLFVIALVVEGRPIMPRFEETPYFILLGCLGFGIIQFLYVMSLFLISPTLASILWQSNPIITSILAVSLHLEPRPIASDPLSWLSLFSVLITVSGSVLVISSPLFVETDSFSIGEEAPILPRSLPLSLLDCSSLSSLFPLSSLPSSTPLSSLFSSPDSPFSRSSSSSSSDVFDYLMGSSIILLMTVMYAFYLVLLKKYVFLRGFSSEYQKHAEGPLYFVVVFIANFFHWEIEQPFISPSPSNTSSTIPSHLPEKDVDAVFPQSETQGCHAEIELEDVTETEQEEEKLGKELELEEKGALVPVGICHRWAPTPIGLVFLLNLIGTLIVGVMSLFIFIVSPQEILSTSWNAIKIPVLYAAIGNTAIGFSLQSFGVKYLPSSLVSIFGPTQAIGAGIASSILLDETLLPLQYFGGSLVILGLVTFVICSIAKERRVEKV